MKITFYAACLASISYAIDLASMMEFSLAETASQVMKPRTCSWVHEQAVKDLPDFYDLVVKNNKWTDPDFTTDNSSLYWENLG